MERFIKISEDYKTAEGQEFGLVANGIRKEYNNPIFQKYYTLSEAVPNKFDCLGVSAEFKTLLDNFKPVTGIYGLRFELIGLKDGWDISPEYQSNKNNDSANYYDFLTKYLVIKNYEFTNMDMYGAVYQFLEWQNQEKLINIQNFNYPIIAIRVYFFQEEKTETGNYITFKDYNDNDIPSTIYQGSAEELPDNIFIRNLIFNFGYQIENAQDKELRLYTTSKLQYAEEWDSDQNQKILRLRWLEEQEDGSFSIIDDIQDKKDNNDALSFWYNKSIYLYKYTYGRDDSDEYAGSFWDQVATWNHFEYNEGTPIRLVEYNTELDKWQAISNGETKTYTLHEFTTPVVTSDGGKGINNFSDPFNILINITDDDKKNAFVRYKMIIVERNLVQTSGRYTTEMNDVELTNSDIATDEYYYTFDEQSKIIYESNEISFENRDESISQATMALITGLTLECSDNSNGIYRIYGEDNRISAQTNSQKMNITANFNAVNILGLKAGEATITWYYPKENTMFMKPIGENKIISTYNKVNSGDTVNFADMSSQYYVKRADEYCLIEQVTVSGEQTWGFKRNNNNYKYLDDLYFNDLYKKIDTETSLSWTTSEEDSNYYVCTYDLGIAIYGEEDSIEKMTNTISYTIDSFYSSLRTNNTIKCKISRYGRDYWAEKEFFFGHQGNNGTNYAFDISLEREYGDGSIPTADPTNSAITPFLTIGNENWVRIKPTLIYGNEEIDLTQSDSQTISWSWYCLTKNESDNHILTYSNENIKNDYYIKLNLNEMPASYCAILHAQLQKEIPKNKTQTAIHTEEVDGYTTENTASITKDLSSLDNPPERYVTLDAYLPIGLSTNGIDFITYEGATSILYDSQGGNPVYYVGEHRLKDSNDTYLSNIKWDILIPDEEQRQFYPSFEDNLLQPTKMYFDGLSEEVSIVAYEITGTVDSPEYTPIFIQPILIMQNAFGNQTINNWDGSLLIDSEGNYILSAMLGAGIKNSDNSFSGVLLGKIGTLEKNETGLYGFGHGLQTYGFREDGTAFIGRSGSGRIEFDGRTDKGLLLGGYTPILKEVPATENGYTMVINLSEGKIVGTKKEEYSSGGGVSHYHYVFDAQAPTTSSTTDRFPLRLGSIGSENFKVSWDGVIYTSGMVIGNAFNLDGSTNSTTVQTTESSRLEDLLLGIYQDYTNRDSADMSTLEAEMQSGDAALQNSLSEAESSLNESIQNETEAREEEFRISFQPQNLYESMVKTVDLNGGQSKYFLVTNKTYGIDSSETEFLIASSAENIKPLFVKNLVAEGVVSAQAGQFGGWNLLPGLMHYGYKTSAHINAKCGMTWYGDFIQNWYQRKEYKDTEGNYYTEDAPGRTAVWRTVDLETLATSALFDKTLRLKKDKVVKVGSTKAFIYLGDEGHGIGITNFSGKTLSQEDDVYILPNPDENDLTQGYIKNVIFSLGQNFAVDSDGSIFAHNGNFDGIITAHGGEIGGWSIYDGILGYRVSLDIDEDNTLINGIKTYKDSNNVDQFYSNFSFIVPSGDKIESDTESFDIAGSGPKTDWVIDISNKFGIRSNGTMYATALVLSQGATEDKSITKKIVNIIYYTLSSIKIGDSALGNSYPDMVYYIDTKTAAFVSKLSPDTFDDTIYYDVNRDVYYDGFDTGGITLKVMKKNNNTNVTTYPMITIGGIDEHGNLDNTKAGLLCARDVQLSGTISASAGNIGPWTINTEGLIFDITGEGSGDKGYKAFFAPQGQDSEHTITIGGRTNYDWVLGINSKFGVTTEGVLYATGADIGGKITAIEGAIGGWEITKIETSTDTDNNIVTTGGQLKSTLTGTTIIFDPLGNNTVTIQYKTDANNQPINSAIQNSVLQVGTNFVITQTGEVYALKIKTALIESDLLTETKWNTDEVNEDDDEDDNDEGSGSSEATVRSLTWNSTGIPKAGFWENSLFTVMKSVKRPDGTTGKYNFSETGNGDHYLYAGFLRGAGPSSNTPGNVFFGVKYSNINQALNTADNTFWNTSPYAAWVKFNGSARFWSVTVGGATSGFGRSGDTLAGKSTDSNEYYTTVGASSNNNGFKEGVYGISHNGDGFFNNIYLRNDTSNVRILFKKAPASGAKRDAYIRLADNDSSHYPLACSGDLYINCELNDSEGYIKDHAPYQTNGSNYSSYKGFIGRALYNLNTDIESLKSKTGYADKDNKDNVISGIVKGSSGESSSGTWNECLIKQGVVKYYLPNIPDVSGLEARVDELERAVGSLQVWQVSVNNFISTYSDIRLKQNLKQIENLDLYDNIIPYAFEWKATGEKSYGFMAQEIEKLSQKYKNDSDSLFYTTNNTHPEFIDDDKEYRVNYQQFHALHLAKNHQQDKRIKVLEEEVIQLRKKIEELLREKGGK